MAEMTDRELNEHMDDYEQVSPSLCTQRRQQSVPIELRLVTPLFEFHFRTDLRLIFFAFVCHNFGRHLGHALFSS